MIIARILIGLVCALPALAADVTGHWVFEGDITGNPVNLECELKQHGTRLEGICKSKTGEIKVAGEVSDPKVRFSYAVDYEGTTYTLYYSGTLESGSSLKGEIEVSGTTGSFSARKGK